MMKKLSLILAVLMALCACAFAETAETAPALTAEDLIGAWNMEYVTADGFMVNAASYGLNVTLTIRADGSAKLEYVGLPASDMQWRIENGRAYLDGYYEDEAVEMRIDDDGVMEIADSIGNMYLTRAIAQEAE